MEERTERPLARSPDGTTLRNLAACCSRAGRLTAATITVNTAVSRSSAGSTVAALPLSALDPPAGTRSRSPSSHPSSLGLLVAVFLSIPCATRWSAHKPGSAGDVLAMAAHLTPERRSTAVVLPRGVDLLADRDAGERVHQLVRVVVIGAVPIFEPIRRSARLRRKFHVPHGLAVGEWLPDPLGHTRRYRDGTRVHGDSRAAATSGDDHLPPSGARRR
jgi:hypothetical protein